MTEVAVRVGRQTKWISGLTEATTCKVRWEKHRLQTIYELDAARVQNLLGTGFPSRLLEQYAKYTPQYFAFKLTLLALKTVILESEQEQLNCVGGEVKPEKAWPWSLHF